GHHIAVAYREQAVMSGIESQARRRIATGEIVLLDQGHLLRVDHRYLVPVFEIGVNDALAFAGGELRLGSKGDRAFDLERIGVDDGGIFGASVEGKDAVRSCVIVNGVRVLSGRDLAEGLESLQIEDGNVVAPAVADEALVQLGREGNSMHARRVGNVACNFVGIEVDHHDMGGMRHVQTACRAVDRKIIPAAVTADFYLSDDVVVRSGQGCGRGQKQYRCKSTHSQQHDAAI